MKITKHTEFISQFPYLNQSFDIKKANWKIESQQQQIDLQKSAIRSCNQFNEKVQLNLSLKSLEASLNKWQNEKK